VSCGHRVTPAKIALSELLVKLGHQQAVRRLDDTVTSHPNTQVRLQAIDALTYVGEAAKLALPALSLAVLTLALTGLYAPRTH
jgi:hypothetical protein